MSSFAARRLLQITILFVASGCSQNFAAGPQLYAGTSPAWTDPATHFYGNDLMYASQPGSNQVTVYTRKKNGYTLTPYETLTSGFSKPMGMVTTPDGHWYVANSGASDVLLYRTTRTGPKGPKETLSDGGQVPVNVATTVNRRLVAVSNGATTSGAAGSVSVYLKRQTEPSRILTYGHDLLQGEGVAIDANGNCFWSFNDPDKLTGEIVKFAGCSGSGRLFASGILKAGGLAFDHSGNLYYVDQLLGIFKCQGSSCTLFAPVVLGGLVAPVNINFDRSNPQNLWVADAVGNIDAVNLSGLIAYLLQIIGGVTNPPIGVAPVPGG
jgi:hypothetical protein